ncbi:Uncharacterised protein [Chlamydia abortus]|nr:Uncharacterised protein [Chlamydia abortus]
MKDPGVNMSDVSIFHWVRNLIVYRLLSSHFVFDREDNLQQINQPQEAETRLFLRELAWSPGSDGCVAREDWEKVVDGYDCHFLTYACVLE